MSAPQTPPGNFNSAVGAPTRGPDSGMMGPTHGMTGRHGQSSQEIGGRLKMDLDKQSIRSKKRKELFVQVLFGLVANVVNIAPGMSLGFSAVALPSMENQNATFHVNKEEASWIASIASISTPVGCILTGTILERFGRKMTLLAVNLPCLLGWLLIAFAQGDFTLSMIYAGRFFTGLATGMGSVPATVYSAEMSSDSLRGMFVTWTSIGISLGILLIYVLGYFMPDDWRMMAGASAVFPACAILLIYFILPESPSWLLSKGKTIKAEECMKKVRGIPKKEEMPLSVANEFDRLAEKFKDRDSDKGGSTKKKNICKLFFRMGTIKPFIIMNLFFFFQQFSGIFVIVFYAVEVVQKAGIRWNAYLVAILIGLTRVIVTIFMSYISKRYGRRPPSIVSGAGMTICMACLATYLYLQSTNKLSEEAEATWGWIPVTSMVLYILTSTIGFLTLPWAMIGEVFPAEVRGLAAGLTTCFAYIFNFIIVKVYPDMVETLFEYGVFFFFGAFSVIGTVFVILFLPETQGKTLLEIEEYFNKKKVKKQPSPEDGNELIINSGPGATIVPKKS